MNKEELQKYIGSENLTLIEAMQKIDANSAKLLYIVDEDEKLTGCLTDGDIRRWIIGTGILEGKVYQAMNRQPRQLLHTELYKWKKIMTESGVFSLPVIDYEGKIIDIIFERDALTLDNEKINSNGLKGIPVIIMAGGRGTRLYPYTKILPKPLIPIGEVPILERILNKFYQYGAEEFFLTINYKKEIIKAYFSDLELPYKICYIEETSPLGTAGSIRLINKIFETPVIITNCDTLIETDYGKVLEYHAASENDMTIISSSKNIIIPYGVLHSQRGGTISSIEEKPRMAYFINTGMYIVNPEFLEWIPENRVFHMTDLVEKMMEEGKKVGMYPISENSFLDMGEFEEMKKMEERLNNGAIN